MNQNQTDTETMNVTDDELIADEAMSFKNGPSLLWLFLTGTARDILQLADDKLYSFRNWLIVTMIAPIALLVLGVAIAAGSDDISGVHFGQGVITIAGFLATVFSGLLLLRARIYAILFLAVGKAAHATLRVTPEIDSEPVRRYVQYFYGIWTWIAGMCLYAQIIPIYRNVGTALVVATAMMTLSGIMAAGWFGGKRAQKILLGLVIATVIISTGRLASPRFLNTMEEAQDFALGTDGRTDADRKLIRRFKADLQKIRERAATECGGKYCTEAERNEALSLIEQIKDLETGRHWKKLEEGDKAEPATMEKKATAPATEGTETEDAPTVEQKPVTRPASTKAKRSEQVRKAFAELDQFPDIVGQK